MFSYSKEDSGDHAEYFGLPRELKISSDSSERGSILMTCWEGCFQPRVRLWKQEGMILEMIFQGLCQVSINNNNNYYYPGEADKE